MSTPLIYSKISQVMTGVGAIAKTQRNQGQGYNFRGIDDVYNALHPKLADAKIFWVPEVLDSTQEVFEIQDDRGKIRRSFRVKLRVKYMLFAEDGSSISTTVEGEGVDSGDKATSKALSSALKYMVMQIFCIPTDDMVDADKESPEVGVAPAPINYAPKASSAQHQGAVKAQAPRGSAPVVPAPDDEPFTEDVGKKIIQVGKKYKGMAIEMVSKDALKAYCDWIESQAQQSGQPVSADMMAFLEDAYRYFERKGTA